MNRRQLFLGAAAAMAAPALPVFANPLCRGIDLASGPDMTVITEFDLSAGAINYCHTWSFAPGEVGAYEFELKKALSRATARRSI
jgi:hypothetical protein